jgi:hypothetical protein
VMEFSHTSPSNDHASATIRQQFFKKPGITSHYISPQSNIGGGFKGDGMGIGRSIRADIVAAALRAAGVSNPVILPRSVTKR